MMETAPKINSSVCALKHINSFKVVIKNYSLNDTCSVVTTFSTSVKGMLDFNTVLQNFLFCTSEEILLFWAKPIVFNSS